LKWFHAYDVLSPVHHALVSLLDEVHLATQIDTKPVREKKQQMTTLKKTHHKRVRLLKRLDLTTALTAAFMPWESPPLVNTAMPFPF
jgi:hypothetical protein